MDAADPVDFLTNLPGLLGYYPAESLVLVFGDRYLDDPGPVLVRDLDGGESGAVRMASEAMAAEGHERADAYVITENRGAGPGGWQAILSGISFDLEEEGFDVIIAARTDHLCAGSVVSTPDGERLGTLRDPAASWASGKLHGTGEAISRDADALRERFRPEPAACRIAAGEALRRAHDDVRGVRRSGGLPGLEAMAQVREHHLEWLALIDAVDRGDICVDDALTDALHLRTLARPLVSLLLRDMTMCEILGSAAETVRALWLGCGRLFRGSARANALACYAIDRHVHGNPAIARAALDAALETDPDHSLSQLLFAAMASGRGHEALRSMLEATTAILGEVHPDAAVDVEDEDGDGPASR
ncbi:Uncharacterised protein [Clostridium paraputrificum]|nr:Uncharacterised protein [Clostridium paraputrificum]